MRGHGARSATPARALILAAFAACGDGSFGDGSDHEGETPAGLTIEPVDAILFIDDGVPAVQTYVATANWSDGSTSDVSAEVIWSADDGRIGRFDGPEFTSGTDRGGITIARASLGETSSATSVTLVLRAEHDDPAAADLPDGPAGLFGGGEDPGRAPQLVYPTDGVIVPPNLGKLEIHFLPGPGNSVFEIGFESATTDVRVYTTCVTPMNGGCIYLPDPEVWHWIAESNRGTAPVAIRVRGTDGSGLSFGASAPIEAAFSYDDIRGGIYYWTTSQVSGGTTAIMRWDFASSTQSDPELFIDTSMTGGNCVGCHALSGAGDKLLTATDGSYGGMVLLLDVATRSAMVPYDSTPRSAFSSWSPGGAQYVGTYANEQAAGWLSYDLNLFDGETGAHVATIPVGGSEASPSAHPDWSPDGDRIAYTRYGIAGDTGNGTTARGSEGSLRLVTREGGVWGASIALTAAETGANRYYPTVSPEGDLLAFNRSGCASGQNETSCDAYDDPEAQVHVIVPEAGAAPVELAKANAPGAMDQAPRVQNSFPKWAPFTFRLDSETPTRLHWITFSSNRRYGLRTIPSTHTLIWMAAVRPDDALAGNDPSAPALALPFQDLATDNHTAQWAQQVVGGIE
jgi:hypothetical protein